MPEQGHISLPYWGIEEYLPLAVCWVLLGAISWWILQRKAPKIPVALRVGLVSICGVVAGLVGVFSVLMILAELVEGQPHGPSPLLMGLFCLPFAIVLTAITRWLDLARESNPS